MTKIKQTDYLCVFLCVLVIPAQCVAAQCTAQLLSDWSRLVTISGTRLVFNQEKAIILNLTSDKLR